MHFLLKMGLTCVLKSTVRWRVATNATTARTTTKQAIVSVILLDCSIKNSPLNLPFFIRKRLINRLRTKKTGITYFSGMIIRPAFPLLLAIALLAGNHAVPHISRRNIRTPEYKALEARLSKGWNTWYNNSILTHALLPQGFSINLCLNTRDNKAYLKDALKASDILKRPEKVLLGLRSDDGSYTSLQITYMGIDLSIETATDGDDELILVSPAKPSQNALVVEAGLLWN